MQCMHVVVQDDNTPLHMASMEGHATVVRYLIRKGANAAITNKVWTIVIILLQLCIHACMHACI